MIVYGIYIKGKLLHTLFATRAVAEASINLSYSDAAPGRRIDDDPQIIELYVHQSADHI